MVIALQNKGNITKIVGDARLKHTQGGSVSITARLYSQLEKIARVISGRVWRKAACRTMFKALVYWQNHHLSGATQSTMVEHASQVCADTRVLAVIPA